MSSHGLACISAIAVLENGRPLDVQKANTLVFDVHLFLSDTAEGGALATMRYFNGDGIVFGDVGYYFIVANVARVEDGIVGIAPDDVKDYAIVGDIISLIPAGEKVNPAHQPFINISGVVDNTNQADVTFDLTPDQYVSGLKGIKDCRPIFPVRVFVQDSPRWKFNGEDKRPRPKPGSYVSLGGFLTGVVRDTQTEKITHFNVDLQQITYLGRAPVLPSKASVGSIETPLKGKGRKFSYNTPSPLVANVKRRRTEPESSASSSMIASSSNLAQT